MRRRLFKNLITPPCTEAVSEPPHLFEAAGEELRGAIARRLGRSLSIREVDAGSCNGCELEIHALGNAFYDLERFGLRFVASPRHAAVLIAAAPRRAPPNGSRGCWLCSSRDETPADRHSGDQTKMHGSGAAAY